jgi:hypothetical protein
MNYKTLEEAYNSVVIGTELPTLWVTPDGVFERDKETGEVFQYPLPEFEDES